MMNHQEYLDEKLHELRVVCHVQWDYISYSDLTNWLDDNFGDDIEGKYYATKILLHTLYYKKKDIEKLIAYGLYEKIYGEIVKSELISKQNIYLSPAESLAKVNKLKDSTFFVPLLDSNKPHESGNNIIGDLVHKLSISPDQVDYHTVVTEEKLKNYKLLVFVDDCLGSGNQLKRFWNTPIIKEIKGICEKYDIKIYYLVLVAYDKNVKRLNEQKNTLGIEVVVCDVLSDKNRVYSEENIIWDKDTNEKEKAIAYFEKIQKLKGINLLGYKKLDFAIILHDRLPNWSLPIFWQENISWKNLLKRKTSLM